MPTVPFIKLMFRLEELMKFKQEHPIIEEAHENILTPEDAEWGWQGVHPPLRPAQESW